MAEFFSQAPLDFGARYLYEGPASIGNSILQAFTAKYNAKRDDDRLKMQMALQEEARKRALQDQFVKEAAGYGVSPIVDQSGNIDMAGTGAAMRKAQTMQDLLRKDLADRQAFANDTSQQAAALGIKPETAPAMANSVIPGLDVSFKESPESLAGRVTQAKNQQAIDLTRAKAEAETQAGVRQPYKEIGPFADRSGNFLGVGVMQQYGKDAGKIGFVGADGGFTPLPDGAIQTVPSQQQRQVLPFGEFRKIESDVLDDEKSLRQFERYAQSQGDTAKGLDRLANQVSGGFKTLFNSGQLTKEQLAQAIAQGQLQSLLGGARLSVIGPGVMTEQDAVRLVSSLGGDVNALQNPEVVRQQLAAAYNDRFQNYQRNLRDLNFQIDQFYGGKGFSKREARDYSKLLAPDATSNPSYVDPQRFGEQTTPAMAQPTISAQDQQALEWAKANPNDPRAAKILQKLTSR